MTARFSCVPDIRFQPIVGLGGSADEIHLEVLSSRPEQLLELTAGRRRKHDLGSLFLAAYRVAKWQAQWGTPTGITVNVSPYDLVAEDFAPSVIRALRKAQLPARCLTLELVETDPLDLGHREVQFSLDILRTHGVGVAIDDAGTGYFETDWIEKMFSGPYRHEAGTWFTWIKLAGKITAQLDDPETEKQARLLLEIARTHGLKTVLEGVEERWQLERAAELGCDYAQGWLAPELGPKMSVDDCAKLLAPKTLAAPVLSAGRA